MSLSFKPRKYTCLDCNSSGKIIAAFSNLRNITEFFPIERIIDPIENIEDSSILYEQILERNDFGMIIKREAVKCKCDSCGSKNIRANKVDSDANVLNFYPSGEPGKWLENFGHK